MVYVQLLIELNRNYYSANALLELKDFIMFLRFTNDKTGVYIKDTHSTQTFN